MQALTSYSIYFLLVAGLSSLAVMLAQIVRKRPRLALLLVVAVAAGCSLASTLNDIAAWTPFAESTFDGFVAIVAPANTSLPNEAQAIAKLISDVGTDATAAAQASGTGVAKVIAAISAVDAAIPQFETDLSAAGATIPASDQKYVAASAAFVLATLEGYEAILQAKQNGASSSAGKASLGDQSARFVAVSTPDGCTGFTPEKETVALDQTSYQPAHLWADCGEKSDAIDLIVAKDGTVSVPSASVTAPPTIANWKRQFNAIARKYGHPEKQLKLTTADHFVHVFTLGKR
jgi:hypothetical protein